MNLARPYKSPLRQKQAEATRNAIVEAAIQLLTDSPHQELSHDRVARHARIATRTVYRYFPSPGELLDAAWNEIDRQLGLSEYPSSESDLLSAAPRVFRRLDERGPLIAALLSSNAGKEMRRRNNERRRAAIRQALRNATTNLPPRKAAQVAGIFQVLFSAPAWQILRERARLPGDDAAEAVHWAMRALLASLYENQMSPPMPVPKKGAAR
ncbi:MAG: TetR/AcrR family transcriptional regulator [Phycisphaerae bacterium]